MNKGEEKKAIDHGFYLQLNESESLQQRFLKNSDKHTNN